MVHVFFPFLNGTDFPIIIYREHSKKFNPEDTKARMDGKNCVVTGANSGIGYATAEGLASRLSSFFLLTSYHI